MPTLPAFSVIRTGTASLLLAASAAHAHVYLLAPNGGEVFRVGDRVQISWEVFIEHNQLDWDLWYSTVSKQGPWTEIAFDLPTGDPTAGSIHEFTWTVPDAVARRGWVRVRQDNMGVDYEDVSDTGFEIIEAPACVADFDEPFGVLDLSDITAFIGAFTATDPLADLDGDGMFDLGDVTAFIAAFTSGCP